MTLAGAALTASLAGCGHGPVTCSDFAAQTVTGQSSSLTGLLVEHQLDRTDPGNVSGVTRAVQLFCRPSALAEGKALANAAEPIDDAVDWTSETWVP